MAAVPVGEQSGGAMALAQSGRTDRRAAVGGVKVTDNTAVVTAGSTNCNGARAADTAAAGMAEGTTAARDGSTETPDTAKLGQGEAAEADLACKPHHRRCETLYIHVRCDPSSAHRMKTPRTYPAAVRNDGALMVHRRMHAKADPEPEPSPHRMNRASLRSMPEKKSTSGSCGAWSSPP
ncbi:hypothetical protein PIB30_098463 [Stylosanthes scabra]|uniref:Uncharacterized protein n=1 Tax=Stylosanthes scabra TaxID=79078 RepID=A0ABU6QVZ4_9FABA|nr:hypothetical protein [Stylosanthes scabra]